MEVVNYYLGDEPTPRRGAGDMRAAPESPAPAAAAVPARFGAGSARRLEDLPVNGKVLDVTA